MYVYMCIYIYMYICVCISCAATGRLGEHALSCGHLPSGHGAAHGLHVLSATGLSVFASSNTSQGVGLGSFALPPSMVRVGASTNSSTQDPHQAISNHHSENTHEHLHCETLTNQEK